MTESAVVDTHAPVERDVIVVTGACVSMVRLSVIETCLPATSVAVKVKLHSPSLEWPARSIPEEKGVHDQGFPLESDEP